MSSSLMMVAVTSYGPLKKTSQKKNKQHWKKKLKKKKTSVLLNAQKKEFEIFIIFF